MTRVGITSKLVKSFINGKYITKNSSSSSSLPLAYILKNAVNDEEVHHFYPSTPLEINEAIETASKAQLSWNKLAPSERSQILLNTANLLATHVNELSTLETLDTGRPISETIFDVYGAIDCLKYFASVCATNMTGEYVDLPGSNFGYTKREPIGNTAGIGAWNYPLQSAIWKSAPALAFGNSMVFKPSEETPLTALKLAELYIKAGLPAGLFNVVLGGGEVGNSLVTHDTIQKISFTGSYETGQKVYSKATLSNMKKVTMELGGKSPLIIFEDADLNEAIKGAMMANWYSSGQVCSNGTRVFVHESIYNEFVEKLITRSKEKLRIGDPMLKETNIGPMITQKHRNKVQSYIELGLLEGATMHLGNLNDFASSSSLDPSLYDIGYFLPPVIFTDCHDGMRIVQEEIFGMVMSILSFSSEEEVIERANATSYGLSAGVFTQDIKRAHRVVHNLQAGCTWINNYNLAPVELPWGGVKQSGLGRENGLAAIDSWTQVKSIYVEMDSIQSPFD